MDHIEKNYIKECENPKTYSEFFKKMKPVASESNKGVNLTKCMLLSMNIYTKMAKIDLNKKTAITKEEYEHS